MKNTQIVIKNPNKVQAFGLFLNKYAGRIGLCVMVFMAMNAMVFATGTTEGGAEGMWSTLWGTITKWVARLGGAIVVYGGIMVGLGWRHNDAAQKTDGWNTVISGAIVAAVCAIANQFVG